MDLRLVFISNGVGIILLFVLGYASRTKVLRRRMEDRIFVAMVRGVGMACLLESLTFALDGRLFPGAWIINYLASAYLYVADLLVPFGVLAYVDLGLYGNRARLWHRYRLQVILGVVLLALLAVNVVFPTCFTLSEGNVYKRGPLSVAFFGAMIYYCMTALLLVRRYERDNGARAFFRIQLYLVPVLIGAALQMVFYGLSLGWLAAAVGLVGIFMMQQNELAYVDGLTDLYNRRYLDHVLASWQDRGAAFAGIMVDVDRFKRINDGFGHWEGDRALKEVACALRDAAQHGMWVFRYAGDEFVVLQLGGTARQLEAYMQQVCERLVAGRKERAYDLAVSYGAAELGMGNVDDLLFRLDEDMYQMKATHHLQRG